jgi:hypothetical protein
MGPGAMGQRYNFERKLFRRHLSGSYIGIIYLSDKTKSGMVEKQLSGILPKF